LNEFFSKFEMAKIDFTLIESIPAHINPLQDHELNLSSLRLSAIENLALTKDLNDTLNLVRPPAHRIVQQCDPGHLQLSAHDTPDESPARKQPGVKD
jgi:hypothetical protein